MPLNPDGLLELTSPEEKERLTLLLRAREKLYPFPSPEVFKVLCEEPLLRIHYAWLEYLGGGGGLTPFSYAGLTGIPPKKVFPLLEKCPYFTCVGWCGDTWLPIVFGTYVTCEFANKRVVKWCNTYDSGAGEWVNSYWDDPDVKPLILKRREEELVTLEHLLERFGGASWKRHCTRRFDPFKQNCALGLRDWKTLKEFYLGKPAGLRG